VSNRSAFISGYYSSSSEKKPYSAEKKLATLRIFLTNARQSVSSDPMSAQDLMDRALDLLSEEAEAPAEDKPAGMCVGGLASWQTLRVQSMIEAQLGDRLLIAELAMAVRLSPSHFARAFKRSLGCSPHHYMLKRRVERAKECMRTTTDPLAQIALNCGFADQAHFTRCFKRCEGETPTAWFRRVNSAATPPERPALAN